MTSSVGSLSIEIAAVVLAAGRGERLRPYTDTVPKPLMPVGSSTLLDLAIESLPVDAADVAVNAHYLSQQIVDHLAGTGVHVEVEPQALASAGAIGNLRSWISGRAVMLRNADAWFDREPRELWLDWTGERPRLLVEEVESGGDFGNLRYLGWSMLPASAALDLPAEPSSLLTLVWQPAFERGEIEFVKFQGLAVDCGTIDDLGRVREYVESR